MVYPTTNRGTVVTRNRIFQAFHLPGGSPIYCYTYDSLAYVSSKLPIESEELITSVVHGRDIVLSEQSLLYLIRAWNYTGHEPVEIKLEFVNGPWWHGLQYKSVRTTKDRKDSVLCWNTSHHVHQRIQKGKLMRNRVLGSLM